MPREGASTAAIGYVPPDPPDTGLWRDDLRWCVTVMDMDDRDLAFVASLLSYALEYGGLTDKQAKYAIKIVRRMRAWWEREYGEHDQDRAVDLATAAPAGRA